jgi:hypothetical protein
MLKQMLIIIITSIIILLILPYAHNTLIYLLQFHQEIIALLNTIFSGSKIALFIRDLLALLFIPLLIIGFISSAYAIIRKHTFPYIIPLAWGTWLVMITALIMKA